MTEEEFRTGVKKDTNPKDAVGTKKVPMSCVPSVVMAEVGLGMMEGARKYGRHNYRAAGIRASVYYDAALRHLFQWWEGEDIDVDSNLSHITKAIATLVVLRDGMLTNTWTDDRPPQIVPGWMNELNKKAGELIEKYPTSAPAHTNSKEPASQHSSDVPVTMRTSLEPSTDSPAPSQPSPQYIPPNPLSKIHEVGELVPVYTVKELREVLSRPVQS